MKLYRVVLRGMNGYAVGTVYGTSYVVADNSDEAYKQVRKFLDDKNLGFKPDREMDHVDLIADTEHYGDCKTLLFIKEN